MLEDVFILGAKRTPMGAFHGVLSSLKAPQFGSIAIRGALEEAVPMKPEWYTMAPIAAIERI